MATLWFKEFSDTGAGLLFFFSHFLFPSLLSLVWFTGYLNGFVLWAVCSWLGFSWFVMGIDQLELRAYSCLNESPEGGEGK